ncbi:hypothetical protein ACFOY4_27995 [Actinomadura syzygii]|uniref:Uncharacterized protein n=1 Tax=Actinomadura syzygii TaxID=1427538 RepID=A0A5D0UHF1_9ACTN|nr:hypothetical protein [Actinomadura syzygii]TYC17464.1 hypothetical protein FXF65_05500 [Actinomadura syzygii]
MSGFEWRRALTGVDPGWWGGPGDRRTVLIMVGAPVPGQPALDVARLAAADPRLRVVCAAAPGPSAAAVEAMLRDAGTAPLSRRDAEGGGFGLAVTASPEAAGAGAPLAVRPGTPQPVPGGAGAVYAWAHDLDRPVRGAASVVVGDATHDRLVASLPLRDFYRRALGVGERARLAVVALPDATLPCAGGRCRSGDVARRLDVVRRLLGGAASGYHVLGVPEPGPGAWDAGVAGLAAHLRDGLRLLPPDADWRAALVAADWIVGAPGPVTRYGTLVGVPVLLDDAGPGTGEEWDGAVRLVPDRPVAVQLAEAAARWRPERVRPVAERITSAPGRFDRNMRRLMYGLLRLPQPATIPVADPVPPPYRIETVFAPSVPSTPSTPSTRVCPAGRPSHACQRG